MQVTFRDIWIDYKNFRSAYFFFQIESPKEIYAKNEVPVDTEKFDLPRFFVNLFRDPKTVYLSPSYLFKSICTLIAIFYFWRFLRLPFEYYYHWQDPLIDKSSGLT